MRIKDLIEQLSTYEENSEVIIYDDDNDREYEIAAIDEDEGDEADGAELRRFFGSEAEVRILLLQLVRESRENDPDSYDNGTESKEEVDSYCSGWLNAYASFSSYHADFTAVLFANMKSIKRNPVVRYVVKNIKWDTDGDQESFDSLPQEVILPAKFSKENYKDENGIFGKAEKIEMLDDISDWLSNGYGFCNNGFELTQKEV